VAHGLNQHQPHPNICRLVMLEFAPALEDLEGPTRTLLDRELSNPDTPVYQYNANSRDLWLEGAPGPDLRALVAKIKELGWVPKGRDQ
jgi:hypothetical protein